MYETVYAGGVKGRCARFSLEFTQDEADEFASSATRALRYLRTHEVKMSDETEDLIGYMPYEYNSIAGRYEVTLIYFDKQVNIFEAMTAATNVSLCELKLVPFLLTKGTEQIKLALKSFTQNSEMIGVATNPRAGRNFVISTDWNSLELRRLIEPVGHASIDRRYCWIFADEIS